MRILAMGDGKVTKEESSRLLAQEGYCVFRVKACGICGSDIPRVLGHAAYHYPLVVGHEFSGIVEDSTRRELIGRRACVFPILPCGKCESCQKQQWASCVSYDYYGSRRDGGMQDRLLIKEENLVFLPDSVSFSAGAMTEPAAVCLHAVKKAMLKKGSRVLIFGAGAIGLLCGMWSRRMGAEVFFSDPDCERIEFARSLGFSDCDGESGFDAVIEASGAGAALTEAIRRIKPCGRIILVGHGRDVSISHDVYVQILRKQIVLEGSWNSDRCDYADDWEDSLSAMADGSVTPEALISHEMLLSNASDAFKIIENKEKYMKIMVVTDDEK